MDAEVLDAWLGDGPMPTTLLIVAHPDDEVAGAGGVLLRRPRTALLHVTEGAPRDLWFAQQAGEATRESYAARRVRELEAALAAGGVRPEWQAGLGMVDQEVWHDLPGLTRALTAIFREMRPALVVTHAYEGGHPDHDSVSFAVHMAVRRLGPERAPVVAEMAGYHEVDGALRASELLPGEGTERVVRLNRGAMERKRRMLDAFVTQRHVLARFSSEIERFRVGPTPDYSRPPHAGMLHYERWGWAVNGAAWREAARRSAAEMELPWP